MAKTNAEVIRSWSLGNKEAGNGNRSLWHVGPKLYSYFTLIGYVDREKGITFLSRNNHSSTTAQHLSLANRNAPTCTVIETARFEMGGDVLPDPQSVILELLKRKDESLAKAKRARTRRDEHLNSAREYLHQAATLLRAYGIKVSDYENLRDQAALAAAIFEAAA